MEKKISDELDNFSCTVQDNFCELSETVNRFNATYILSKLEESLNFESIKLYIDISISIIEFN